MLQKALQLGLKPILLINKVDKDNCRPDEVHEAVFDWMLEKGIVIGLDELDEQE